MSPCVGLTASAIQHHVSHRVHPCPLSEEGRSLHHTLSGVSGRAMTTLLAALPWAPGQPTQASRGPRSVAVGQDHPCRADRKTWTPAEKADHGHTDDRVHRCRLGNALEPRVSRDTFVSIRKAISPWVWCRTVSGHIHRSRLWVYRQPLLLWLVVMPPLAREATPFPPPNHATLWQIWVPDSRPVSKGGGSL
jgi:hypothetical protein